MDSDISICAFNLVIDGKRVATPASMPVLDPATEQVIALAPDGTAEQLDQAVAAARRAFPAWRETGWPRRAEHLREIARRIEKNSEMLAVILMREQGKPLIDARGEIANMVRWFDHYADLDLPDEARRGDNGKVAEVRRVPLGVVGAIVPWNFPMSLAAWKIAPALLAGNTVVLKPSPFTPLGALALGELLLDLLPPGVLNVVAGGDHLGPLMSGHPDIDKIAFTGSTSTGKAVMRGAAGTLKRLTLELGGNDAAIVLPDVDVESTAEKIFWGAFRNCGQICVAAKRIYVHDAIYDRFAARMAELARATQPARGDLEGAMIGPVQNRQQFERVKAMIEEARTAGLTFLSDPGPMQGPGYFIAPTIIDNPPEDAPVVQDEPFGPLLPLIRFSDIDDVVRRANASQYGLAGSVWSADEELAARIARRLETGTVWINAILGISPSFPFGGHKQSGIGVENALEGLEEYTNIQAIIR